MSNNMSKISKLISNIHKYGNCKVYFKPDDYHKTVSEVLEFSVDEMGKLNMVLKREYYNKPYWDGNFVDSSAKMELSPSVIKKYSESDLVMNIATILYYSFYGGCTIITHEENQTQVNTDKVASTIYQIVNSMLQLSDKDLTKWVIGGEKSIDNILIKKLPQRVPTEDMITTSSAIENIEEQFNNVYIRLAKIHYIWNKMRNARTKDEFKIAKDKWETLCKDDGKNGKTLSKKKNRI